MFCIFAIVRYLMQLARFIFPRHQCLHRNSAYILVFPRITEIQNWRLTGEFTSNSIQFPFHSPTLFCTIFLTFQIVAWVEMSKWLETWKFSTCDSNMTRANICHRVIGLMCAASWLLAYTSWLFAYTSWRFAYASWLLVFTAWLRAYMSRLRTRVTCVHVMIPYVHVMTFCARVMTSCVHVMPSCARVITTCVHVADFVVEARGLTNQRGELKD